jgi:miniconductance mechanosensitive channel
MNEIFELLDKLFELCGLHGAQIAIASHIALVALAVIIAWICGYACKRLLIPIIKKVTARTAAKWDDIVFSDKVLRTACRIVPAIVIWVLLPKVFYLFPDVEEMLKRLTAIYITVMTVCLAVALIDSINKIDMAASSSTRQYIKSFTGLMRVIIIFLSAIIVIAIAFGKNPMTLIAGLGATSAILMLVFKDTIEGLVAGIRLTSNDMVHKGDWITVPTAGADGIVQSITLSTVKIQNFDNTIITVSPTALVNGSFQNWKGMQEGAGRRVKRMIFFDFRYIKRMSEERLKTLADKGIITAEEAKGEHVNMELFRTATERMLRARPEVNARMTLMVRQLQATSEGLPMEIYFFLKEKEWVEYEHQLATIMEWIYAIAPEFELKIYQKYIQQ